MFSVTTNLTITVILYICHYTIYRLLYWLHLLSMMFFLVHPFESLSFFIPFYCQIIFRYITLCLSLCQLMDKMTFKNVSHTPLPSTKSSGVLICEISHQSGLQNSTHSPFLISIIINLSLGSLHTSHTSLLFPIPWKLQVYTNLGAFAFPLSSD